MGCRPADEVTVALYVPVAAVVVLVIEGFCEPDVNAFGPVQLNVAPTPVSVRLSAFPEHTGLLLPKVGTTGTGLTVTTTGVELNIRLNRYH